MTLVPPYCQDSVPHEACRYVGTSRINSLCKANLSSCGVLRMPFKLDEPLSLFMHEITRELLKRFPRNLMIGILTELFRPVQCWLKSDKENEHLNTKNCKLFCSYLDRKCLIGTVEIHISAHFSAHISSVTVKFLTEQKNVWRWSCGDRQATCLTFNIVVYFTEDKHFLIIKFED